MTLLYEWPDDAAERWTNFSAEEMQCKCGCGALPDALFMDSLQEIRGDVGFALTVTSGARCPDYNERVSATGRTGPHTSGLAADIGVSGHMAHALIAAAVKRGMTGIGVSQRGPHGARFIHLDMIEDSQTRPWVWSYG